MQEYDLGIVDWSSDVCSSELAAFARGATVTVDGVEALHCWPELFRGREFWLRLDLGRGEGHHHKVRTGGSEAKFGLPVARLDEFIAATRSLDAHITGLHAHQGSGVEVAGHCRQVYAAIAGLAERLGTVSRSEDRREGKRGVRP